MSPFQLEIFAPRDEPAAPRLSARDLRAVREEAYREGYLAGRAAEVEAGIEDQTRLSSAFIEAINDARLSNEAARLHVAASLAPMVRALCAALTPALAEAGLGAEIAARVERALASAPEARPRLRCAPETAPAIAALLLARGLSATVEAAAELLPREAELHWDEGFDRIDLDACAAGIAACVASHIDPRGEEADHDRPERG